MKYKKIRYISPVTAALYIFEISDDSDAANLGIFTAILVHGNIGTMPTSTSSSIGLEDLENVKIPELVYGIENPEL